MSRDLRSEIHAFLEAGNPATASEIALGVRARRADVVNALAGFPRVPAPVGVNHRSAYYAVSQAVPHSEGGTPSQNARILQALRDGKPHTTAEIHTAAGFSRLNSRIAELRARGYVFEVERVDGVPAGPHAQTYRLIATPEGLLGESGRSEPSPGHPDSPRVVAA